MYLKRHYGIRIEYERKVRLKYADMKKFIQKKGIIFKINLDNFWINAKNVEIVEKRKCWIRGLIIK